LFIVNDHLFFFYKKGGSSELVDKIYFEAAVKLGKVLAENKIKIIVIFCFFF
jgi:hypothetical protein